MARAESASPRRLTCRPRPRPPAPASPPRGCATRSSRWARPCRPPCSPRPPCAGAGVLVKRAVTLSLPVCEYHRRRGRLVEPDVLPGPVADRRARGRGVRRRLHRLRGLQLPGGGRRVRVRRDDGGRHDGGRRRPERCQPPSGVAHPGRGEQGVGRPWGRRWGRPKPTAVRPWAFGGTYSSANGTGTSAGAPTSARPPAGAGRTGAGRSALRPHRQELPRLPGRRQLVGANRTAANGSPPSSWAQPQLQLSPSTGFGGICRPSGSPGASPSGRTRTRSPCPCQPSHRSTCSPRLQPVGPDQGLGPAAAGRKAPVAVTSVRAAPPGRSASARPPGRGAGPRPRRPSPASGRRSRSRPSTGRPWTGPRR